MITDPEVAHIEALGMLETHGADRDTKGGGIAGDDGSRGLRVCQVAKGFSRG